MHLYIPPSRHHHILYTATVLATLLTPAHPDPSRIGQWAVGPSTGVVGIHTALLPDNHLLFFERFHGLHYPSLYPPNPNTYSSNISQSEISTEMTFNPENPLTSGYVVEHETYSPFCAGHAQMADGRIFVAGGDGDGVGNGYITDGRKAVRTYASATGWVDIGELSTTRWYPTVATLPDGRLLIVGGLSESYIPDDPNRNNPTYELYPPDGRGTVPLEVLLPGYPNNSYPIVMVLPSQRVFIFSSINSMSININSWDNIITYPPLSKTDIYPSRSFPYLSPSVLLPLRKANKYRAEIMICGGTYINNTASNLCSRIIPDLGEEAKWVDDEMPGGRVMGDGVLLPDGNVVFVGGAQEGTADGPAGFSKATNPQYAAHLYNPRTRQWSVLASATIPRLYHSSALLLPDCRVLTAGSDQQNYANPSLEPFEYRIELFSPPYLFAASRPMITAMPSTISYNSTFQIHTPTSNIEMVSFIRYSTVTHSTNMDQRFVELEFVQTGKGIVEGTSPLDGSLAPPGNWMVFLVKDGVPSVGETVLLH
ncbi:hypothetical protein SeLEV6574_g01526 [Synchytrium endobioticum]|nr:hypothetical protein SeLEV6574_g01526 [Synchytrium endobioticum]